MFRFKQFVIQQDRCAMKVGTDGVLLGAWASIRPSDHRLLDIGTGSGLIALMLAQRAPYAQITGVDIDSVEQACENGNASPWRERIEFVRSAVQEFSADGAFDLILSNPPFFVESLTCPDAGRTTARHAVLLSYEDLRDSVLRLLAPGGHFALILPCAEAERFLTVCRGRLFPIRRCEVRTTPQRAPKRLLLELVREVVPQPLTEELVIGMGEPELYTPQYRALTRDFYLKF